LYKVLRTFESLTVTLAVHVSTFYAFLSPWQPSYLFPTLC